MKKLIIPIILTLLLASCTQSAVPSSAGSKPPMADDLEIATLTPSNGKGLYNFALHEGGASILPYITFIDSATATQAPLCSTPSCQHNTTDCTAVFATLGKFYSYKDKLLYFSEGTSSGYDSTVTFGKQLEPSSIIMTDATGGNRKTIGTISGDFFVGSPIGAYKDNLLYVSTAGEGTILNSMSIATGEVTQVSSVPMQYPEYLDFYKNNCVFISFGHDKSIFTYKACLLNVDDGSIKTLTEYQFPYTLDENANYSVYSKYLNGKIYQYVSTPNGQLDIVRSIDCETGKLTVLCEDIVDESYFGQYIDTIVDDVLIISSPQKGDDMNLPVFRKFTYNLTTGEKGELSLTSKEPVQGKIYPVNIVAQIGDNLYVEQSKKFAKKIVNDLEGMPTEMDSAIIDYALISKADYLSSTPNFKPIVE